MTHDDMLAKVRDGQGFVAALDQSGGSTPGALKGYGVAEDAYSTDEEMFAAIHAMRSRIITSPCFNGDKVIGAILFENIASGIGGVTVVAYFSALCDLRFTASQYALISAATSVVGRVLTGTTAGALVERVGYVNFYLLTTVAAVPGILLFWIMMRSGLIDSSIGTAGKEGEGDARDGGTA